MKIFCKEIHIKLFCKVILSALLGMVSHVQRTHSNKFAKYLLSQEWSGNFSGNISWEQPLCFNQRQLQLVTASEGG